MIQENEPLKGLRKRITRILSEKEELEEENSRLKDQIEQFRIMYISTVEFATTIENEMQKKLNSYSSGLSNITSVDNISLEDLKVRLALQVDINEDLQKKIKYLQEELEKSHLLFFNTVEHSTFLENSLDRKFSEFSRLAETDNLTGIHNRLKFYQSIHKELEKFKIKRSALSIIMFDIDFFKKINDVHGHDKGDVVLVHITQIANKFIRKRDTFSRWGGEEFMILLPETDLEETSAIAERLRVTIAEHAFENVGHVSCSFGVAHYEYPEDVKEFLKRVDVALYQAKETGRNKVIVLGKCGDDFVKPEDEC